MLVVRRNVPYKLRIVRPCWTCRPYEVKHGSVGLEKRRTESGSRRRKLPVCLQKLQKFLDCQREGRRRIQGKHFIQGVRRRLVSRQDRGQRTKGYYQSQRNERITFLHGLRGSRKRLRRIQVRTRCSKTIILQHLYTKKRVFIMRQYAS